MTEEGKVCLFVQSETSTGGIGKPTGTISFADQQELKHIAMVSEREWEE